MIALGPPLVVDVHIVDSFAKKDADDFSRLIYSQHLRHLFYVPCIRNLSTADNITGFPPAPIERVCKLGTASEFLGHYSAQHVALHTTSPLSNVYIVDTIILSHPRALVNHFVYFFSLYWLTLWIFRCII